MVLSCRINRQIIIVQVTTGKEVHAVAQAVVQSCIDVGVVFFALAICGREIAAPAFTGLAHGLQADDRGDVCAVFRPGICDNLG